MKDNFKLSMKRSNSLYAVFLFICLFSYEGSAKAKDIRIALRAHQGESAALSQWQPTADYLSKEIPSHRFIMVPFANISAMNQAVSSGDFQFNLTNPSSAIEYIKRYNSQPLLTLVNKRHKKGYSQFGSVIFTKSSRKDINQLSDLRGKTFIAVDEQAFGGWRVAWRELLNNNINPFSDFKSLKFSSGNQKSVVYAVLNGEADAGSVRTDMLERMAERGNIRLSDFKVVGEKKIKGFPFLLSTDLYPEWLFSALVTADENLKEKVVKAMLSISIEDKAALKGKYVKWIAPLDYLPVDELLRELKVGPYNIATLDAYERLISQYGDVVFFVTVAFILLVFAFLYVLKLNKNILIAKEALKKEISIRSNIERQLLHSQRIESLGQLTGGIAHDFNNMLASIMGHTELALMTDTVKNNEKISKYLNQVITTSKKSSALVKQMLAFSREAADTDKNETLSVLDVVNGAYNMLKPIIPSSLKFTIKNIDENLFINANSGMMTQILMNLYLNSKDAITNSHGMLSINAKAVSFNGGEVFCDSCHQDIRGDFVEISVEDNGCGIDADTINRLFEPFFTTKEVGEGTGMGLSMVHGIVHKNAGHILVESEIHKGTRIKILMPQVSSEHYEKPVNKVVEYNGNESNKHIMLVDDEVAITVYLSEFLRQHGFKVTTFNNSEDALSYFSKNSNDIDLIITDQTMPDLTGIELSEKIQSYSADTPIILCSGYCEGIDEKIKPIQSIKAFMNKPMESNKLLTKINSLLKLS